MHLHLLKFTCCKQDLHWRSSNLGQEVLKKTPFATPGCGDGGENIHVDVTPRAGRWGLPPTALPQPAQILPRRNCSREGDTGRTSSPKAPGLSVGWKYQLEAPLFCSLIKMVFIIKSRKPGRLLWMKHWLSCAQDFGKIATGAEITATCASPTGNVCWQCRYTFVWCDAYFNNFQNTLKDPQPTDHNA